MSVPYLKLGVIGIALAVGSLFAGGDWDAFLRLARPSAANDRNPRIELDRTTYEFGAVPSDATVVACFTIRNRGGRRLIVAEHSRGCACLSSRTPETVVPPGGRTDLEVGLDCSGLQGRVARHIQYATNDPQQRFLTLTLIADIESDTP